LTPDRNQGHYLPVFLTNYGKEEEMALERLSFGDLSQPEEPDIPNPHNTFEGLLFC